MERMRQVDNAEKARQEGVAIAREMVERVRTHGAGRAVERSFRAIPDGYRRRGSDWAALGNCEAYGN